MRALLQLIIRNGGLAFFLLMELLCFVIIVQFNQEKQGKIWANTVEIFGGRMFERRQRISDYFKLEARADTLAMYVDSLQARLANARMVQVPVKDTFYLVRFDSLFNQDSIRRKMVRPHYSFVNARVISNALSGANNWLLLNRGKTDGVGTDMAVVSPSGIVGIVRHVSENFSLAMSVLHQQSKISVALPKQKNAFGTLTWSGSDPAEMTLRYVPQHFDVNAGEPVVTSGYSLMFPQGHPVGIVVGKPRPDPENPYFLEIRVRLSQDMATVRDVAVVRNLFKSELDSLQSKINTR